MLVEIEGIDASGKTTLIENLSTYFKTQGKSVLCLKFPDTGSTVSGKLIRSWLAKEWTTGDTQRDAVINQSLNFVNRMEQIPVPHLFDYVLMDRYNTSALVYGGMDGVPYVWLEKLAQQLPRPDVSILLNISAEESFRRKQVRDDRYEENKEFLEGVAQRYLEEFRDGSPNKFIVDAERQTKSWVFDQVLMILEGVRK